MDLFQKFLTTVQTHLVLFSSLCKGRLRQTLLPASKREASRSSLGFRSQSRAQAYLELTKPKIVFLLDFTALMAFLVATRSINVLNLAVILVAGTLASGGAGALNCYLDRDIDQSMGRTSQRPIPKGEVSPFNALVFGLALLAGGVGVSLLFLSLWASLFIFLGAAIYVGFYTKWL